MGGWGGCCFFVVVFVVVVVVVFCLFVCFALACDKMHSTKSRFVKGPETILFAYVCMHILARKFYRLGSEGV